MKNISFVGAADFDKTYIKSFVDLPPRYVEQIEGKAEKNFSVFRRNEQPCNIEITANRSEFYKILLMTKGSGEFDYGLQTYQVEPGSLIFVRPSEVKACGETTEEQDGYYCTFTEQFYSSNMAFVREMKLAAMFAPDAYPIVQLTDLQLETITKVFERLHFEFNHYDAIYSDEILRLYLRILLVESTRIYAEQFIDSPKRSASFEIAQRFNDLLDQQFKIVTNGKIPKLTSPSQFADKLSVHPNHLNASLKQALGKSTRKLINDRILMESQILLKYTDKQVSEISHLLGFKESSSFIHFFRRNTGLTPNNYRLALQPGT
jgi:AraC family transcriptional regulator, transcriptional activator of pobA